MADRSGDLKRLFVAVDLDEPTRAQVQSVVSGFSRTAGLSRTAGAGRITWVPPDRLHLTLEFFGNADAALEQAVLSALEQPIPMAPFDLAFSGVGFFPPKGSPRVLWLGIAAGLRELRQLHGLLHHRLVERPGPREVFTPHLTLARFRDRVARPAPEALSKIEASAGPCRIDRVTLYESRLSPRGPAYSALATAALAPCI